jgi:hypothetical protein
MKGRKLATTEKEGSWPRQKKKRMLEYICYKKPKAQHRVPQSSHAGNSHVEPAEKEFPL